MKRLYLLIAIFIGLDLTGCAITTHPAPTQQVTPAPRLAKQYSLKDPIAVEVFPQGSKPPHPYKIIANESVSKFNTAGIKRQEGIIGDALRNLAASVGGDAVIDVTRDDKRVTGTIVSFDKGVG